MKLGSAQVKFVVTLSVGVLVTILMPTRPSLAAVTYSDVSLCATTSAWSDQPLVTNQEPITSALAPSSVVSLSDTGGITPAISRFALDFNPDTDFFEVSGQVDLQHSSGPFGLATANLNGASTCAPSEISQITFRVDVQTTALVTAILFWDETASGLGQPTGFVRLIAPNGATLVNLTTSGSSVAQAVVLEPNGDYRAQINLFARERGTTGPAMLRADINLRIDFSPTTCMAALGAGLQYNTDNCPLILGSTCAEIALTPTTATIGEAAAACGYDRFQFVNFVNVDEAADGCDNGSINNPGCDDIRRSKDSQFPVATYIDPPDMGYVYMNDAGSAADRYPWYYDEGSCRLPMGGVAVPCWAPFSGPFPTSNSGSLSFFDAPHTAVGTRLAFTTQLYGIVGSGLSKTGEAVNVPGIPTRVRWEYIGGAADSIERRSLPATGEATSSGTYRLVGLYDSDPPEVAADNASALASFAASAVPALGLFGTVVACFGLISAGIVATKKRKTC